MKKNYILFIAGGPWQKPFVKYLKNKGHFIAIVNPVVTDTTLLADIHIKCDISDLKTIEKYIKKLNPIFITSDQSDISTHTVNFLSNRWGLPCNDMEAINKLTNKLSIYKFAKKLNIKTPKTILINSIKDIKKLFLSIKEPIIIKPVDSTNSRGFKKIEDLKDINETTYQKTKNFSKTKQVIAQKFINGQMITLDGICSNNKHKTIVGAIKKNYFKPGINQDITYPIDLIKNIYKKIVKSNDEYVEKSGMKFGLTHSEYIICNQDFYLIEIGGRGGGAGITDKIIPWVSGINIYDILYASLIGDVVDLEKIKPQSNWAKLKYYKKNEIKKLNKKEIKKILEINGVADFQYAFKSKQFISDPEDCRESLVIYLAKSETKIKKIISKVESIITPLKNANF